ncbi:bacillithiol system redox-active protein YtxJ [Lentibacillus sp.]|jgi:bacillithiol system protein YtxJ|uniref:bacillithiol system redox-active protein YtxJ n=1 Tax=Lentibacillus sp. TaxID=1925746 RepID=UPI002B4B713E|nr:bacillithiol system redox-active protein YtxJ [Lentibacillus sp.]HLS10257.1 bacillithiol system redox-active protein YtxJ [Lentibacillus sp.]
MAELKELQSKEELEQAWGRSMEKPVLFFKHSTTCPISAGAYKEYQTFLESAGDDLGVYMVKVIENREISNQIAEETGVKHESPQIFLIKNNKVLWHTSHSKITKDSINQALQQVV